MQRTGGVVQVFALVADRRRGRAAIRAVLAIAERIFSLHDSVNLACAFVYDGAAAVAQVALDGVFRRVTVRAVDLNCVVGALEGYVASMPLGKRGLARGLHSVILHPAHPVAKEPGSLDAVYHLGDHLLHKLELADWPPESVALVGVFH